MRESTLQALLNVSLIVVTSKSGFPFALGGKKFTTSQLSVVFFSVVKSLRLDPLWPQAEALRVHPQRLWLGRKHPAVGTKKKRPKKPLENIGKVYHFCWGKPGKCKVDGGNEGTALRLCFPGRCFFSCRFVVVGWLEVAFCFV